ncbi:hypothetical protein NB311A_11502 [Nitrobacter sp. Nb-311A]|nr:hypothetical protein NB311A_11502 [Nitrobacter sp. Nb-311A]
MLQEIPAFASLSTGLFLQMFGIKDH